MFILWYVSVRPDLVVSSVGRIKLCVSGYKNRKNFVECQTCFQKCHQFFCQKYLASLFFFFFFEIEIRFYHTAQLDP